MIVLSLDAEMSMSGFSEDVASAVTQPLWPSISTFHKDSLPWSVPRRTRLSAILCE